MKSLTLAALLASALMPGLVPAPAQAAPAPRYLPQHDAMITYRSTGSDPNVPASLSIRYSADLGRLRIEGVPLGYVLVDQRMERVELVLPQPRLVIELPPGGGLAEGFILSADLHFSQIGKDTVIGRACTLYDVTADHDRAHGRVCLTADGLLLRGEGQGRDGRTASIEAVAVALGAQPVGLFAPPDGYHVVALPR
jgi:hypothetical protein